MGSLGYAKCIYDSFYPCSAGCDNKKCKYWYDEDAEECEEEENQIQISMIAIAILISDK